MSARLIVWLSLLLILRYPVIGQNCFFPRYLDFVASDVLIYTDIPFATVNPYGIIQSQELKLDFYEPFGDTLAQRPLIIFSFGGAFLIGDKSQPFIPEFCKFFAKHGYAVAAINYRTGFNTLDQGSAERAAYRAVQDIRAAMRFFAELWQTFRIDTNYIFLAGTSAGCVASLHSTFMTEQQRPASTYGTLLEPSDLGCPDCSGNHFYGNREVRVKGIINCWGAILDTLYIDDLTRDSVPVISFHGTNDLIVPYTYGNPFQLPIFPPMYGSLLIHQRLDNMNIYNTLRPFPGAGHEPELLNSWAYADTLFEETKNFLYKILKPNTSLIDGPLTVCAGDTASYSIVPHSGSQYCWNISGGIILSQNAHSVTVLWDNIGLQQISVQEKNSLGATGDWVISALTVVALPHADFHFQQHDGLVYFTNHSNGSVKYYWDFGDGHSSQEYSPAHIFAPGVYPVLLIAENSAGCRDSVEKIIEVALPTFIPDEEAPPTLDIYPNPASSAFLIRCSAGTQRLYTLSLYDVAGRMVLRKDLIGDEKKVIHIAHLPAGIYQAKVQTHNKTFFCKLIRL
ncbi:MAG: hypothetical protein KatS3mg031_2703 [Chitinophagales bacterium]|nr:MAG: hypothetical protein KatS3mg031_2703 [Chitinophagales bacterium]